MINFNTMLLQYCYWNL